MVPPLFGTFRHLDGENLGLVGLGDAADADSVLQYYRRIQAERFNGEAAAILQQGRYEELLADDERIYAFKRILDDQATLTLVNFTNETIEYDASLTDGATVLLGSYGAPEAGRLRPAEAVVYRL